MSQERVHLSLCAAFAIIRRRVDCCIDGHCVMPNGESGEGGATVYFIIQVIVTLAYNGAELTIIA